MRSAGSKGKADILCVGSHAVLAIQVKFPSGEEQPSLTKYKKELAVIAQAQLDYPAVDWIFIVFFQGGCFVWRYGSNTSSPGEPLRLRTHTGVIDWILSLVNREASA